MDEVATRLSSFDTEISHAQLQYELAYDTGDRFAILRTWRELTAAYNSRGEYLDEIRCQQSVA